MARCLLPAILLICAWSAKSFQVPKLPQQGVGRSSSRALIQVYESQDNQNVVDNSKANMKKRLLSESIAPWRTLRLFLYGSLGSGAFLGGFITLTGTLAAMSSNRADFDLNTELLNLGIDFGAVILFAVLAKWDIDKGQELEDKVDEKIQKVKAEKVANKEVKEREKELAGLQVNIQVSADGVMKEATVQELQLGAKQHMIVVIGPKKACRDALVGANLLKMDFAMSNILVVPYETGDDSGLATRPTGFGELPIYERQPYIARPTGEGWEDYVKAEMDAAVVQGGDSVREEGIAIVVASNGSVIRRGVGTLPWRQLVQQLEEAISS